MVNRSTSFTLSALDYERMYKLNMRQRLARPAAIAALGFFYLVALGIMVLSGLDRVASVSTLVAVYAAPFGDLRHCCAN